MNRHRHTDRPLAWRWIGPRHDGDATPVAMTHNKQPDLLSKMSVSQIMYSRQGARSVTVDGDDSVSRPKSRYLRRGVGRNVSDHVRSNWGAQPGGRYEEEKHRK